MLLTPHKSCSSFQCWEFASSCCCSGTWWLLFTSTTDGKTVKLAATWMENWLPMETLPGLSTPVTWVATIWKHYLMFANVHGNQSKGDTTSSCNISSNWTVVLYTSTLGLEMCVHSSTDFLLNINFKTTFCCRSVYQTEKQTSLSCPPHSQIYLISVFAVWGLRGVETILSIF